MKGRFERVSPAAFADKIGIPLGWFVISHRWMPEKKQRRESHGKWFKLSTSSGVVYRVLRFSANLRGAPGSTGDIVLDWPAWLDLFAREENVDGPIEITITPAKWWEYPRLAISHPDPAVRLAGWISIVSLILGALSVVLGGWSLYVTYFPVK
ncbi:hypothetical protein [Pseudomonas aeruginosa]|uniref:hypothetical protein n=1 Tax=Pseudomonas aeruginosa TaxID=287 RepID=UPI0013C4DDEC|nr:hypothetical protein [Pseudomonas aeruginosa]MDO1430072.1 hypothetical protein [Pseudomonas aeruginosa]HBQ8682557.1 hypothetical protein [Klebsiella pneumoniae]